MKRPKPEALPPPPPPRIVKDDGGMWLVLAVTLSVAVTAIVFIVVGQT